MGILLESIFVAIGVMVVALAVSYAVWFVGMYLKDTNDKVTRILKILEEEVEDWEK